MSHEVKISKITKAKRSKSVEDYLEAIYNSTKKGYARNLEISFALKVRPPSVTEMLQKLHRNKLVVYEKRKGVKLTPKGEKLARTIKQNHTILKEFFIALGLSEEIAEENACLVEHCINPSTVKRLRKFMRYIYKINARESNDRMMQLPKLKEHL
jgi:DtxR family Mn-dependent transcriptional regulator